MWSFFRIIGFVLLSLLLTKKASAQNDYVVVDSIVLSGYKHTKVNTILRELDFKQGDTLQLSNLTKRLNQNKLLLLNTGIFTKVEYNLKGWKGDKVKVAFDLKEGGRIYPLPVFQRADRNFNIWLEEHNLSLNRVNYGVALKYRNFTGRKDLLRVTTQFGYEPKYWLSYDLPFFNKSQTLGLKADILFATAKEIGISALDNVLQFYSKEDEEILIRRFRATMSLQYQPKYYTQHEISLSYLQNRIADSVALVNPDYLLDGRTEQRFYVAEYRFQRDYRDFRPYAVEGNFFKATLTKQGFGIHDDINTLTVAGIFAQYLPFGDKWSVEGILRGRYNILRDKQPYLNSRALGYRDEYIRGYERYVIDGLDYVYGQATLRYKLFDKPINFGNSMPKSFRYFPLKLFAKIYSDQGYVNNPYYADDGNDFSNSILWGSGLGVDVVLYNDFVVQVEYTWNKTGEKGLYLHFKLPF